MTALLGDSIYDSAPLQRLIRSYVTPTLLGDVAREYTEKGRLLLVAARALATLVQSQGMGDLSQLYLICQRDGIDYNLAYISRKFTAKLNEPFEQAYMRKLYAFGRQEMLAGRPWSKLPPGYDPTPAGSL